MTVSVQIVPPVAHLLVRLPACGACLLLHAGHRSRDGWRTGCLMYGPPGTGKTLMARACAAQTNACFLKLAGPQLVQMFIGDGPVQDSFRGPLFPCFAFDKVPVLRLGPRRSQDCAGRVRTGQGEGARDHLHR